jgi:hypothetical protein
MALTDEDQSRIQRDLILTRNLDTPMGRSYTKDVSLLLEEIERLKDGAYKAQRAAEKDRERVLEFREVEHFSKSIVQRLMLMEYERRFVGDGSDNARRLIQDARHLHKCFSIPGDDYNFQYRKLLFGAADVRRSSSSDYYNEMYTLDFIENPWLRKPLDTP